MTQDVSELHDANEIIEKIIIDHMKFVCASDAQEIWEKRCHINEESTKFTEIFNIRKKVISLLNKGLSLEAYKCCEEHKVFDDNIREDLEKKNDLSRLVFIDLLKRGEHMAAIKFAKTLINESNEKDKIFTLIGYSNMDDDRVTNIVKSVDRNSIIECINKHLFKKETGREFSLLSLLLNHYNEILKTKKK